MDGFLGPLAVEEEASCGCRFPLQDCQWSPFEPDLLCCAGSQYYGIAGNGAVEVFSLTEAAGPGPGPPGRGPSAGIEKVGEFLTPEGVYAVAWSEQRPDQLVAACAVSERAQTGVRSVRNAPARAGALTPAPPPPPPPPPTTDRSASSPR